jgi:hypothetical protein
MVVQHIAMTNFMKLPPGILFISCGLGAASPASHTNACFYKPLALRI